MDKQIMKTIQGFFGDLADVKTSDFYNDYLDICEKEKIEPREKNVVIREAAQACGVETKRKYYTVFCEVE